MDVLDPETLARLFALQQGLGPEQDVLADLLQIFRVDAARYLADLHTASSTGDDEAARAAIHTLKGAALSVGAARVAALCAELERGTEEDRAAGVPGLTEEVTAAVAALEAVVEDPPRRQT